MASWLVRSSPDRAVRVRALAGEIVLCSWARHFTSTVPAILMLGVTLRWTNILSRASRNTSSRFMLQNRVISSGLMGHLARMQTLPSKARVYIEISIIRNNTVPRLMSGM